VGGLIQLANLSGWEDFTSCTELKNQEFIQLKTPHYKLCFLTKIEIT